MRFWLKNKPKTRSYKVGDKVPPDVLSVMADPSVRNGAMISVCPCCNRIDVIFHP